MLDVEETVESRTPQDVLGLAKDSGAEFVDLRFCDLPGVMQHFSMPIHELTEDGFEDGYGFDGSSIRGFQEIQESDMLLIPDPNTAVVDPFREHSTLNINCYVRDPLTDEILFGQLEHGGTVTIDVNAAGLTFEFAAANPGAANS